MIPFIDLKTQYAELKQQIDEAIQSVLDDGRYIMGPAVKQFEKELSEFVDCKDTVSCSSGTDALLIPLMAKGANCGHGTGKRSAVFVPAFTYTATAEVVLLAGAQPVFVDVDPKTFNMDPASLEREIDRVKKEGELNPHCVIAVDLFGQPADYDAIMPIADAHGMYVLADAAQALGGALGDKRIGSIAPITATSFFPAKPLGCYGDGGAIMTQDEELAAVMRSIRTHGTGSHKYEVIRVGMNGRLDTLQAAILSIKLAAFDKELDARDALAVKYDEQLGDLVDVPARVPNSRSAWAQYVLMTDQREALQAHLKEAGVPTMVYYPKPMHFQTAYKQYGHGEGSMPVSEGLCDKVMALPMHPYMSESDSDAIVAAVRSFFGK